MQIVYHAPKHMAHNIQHGTYNMEQEDEEK